MLRILAVAVSMHRRHGDINLCSGRKGGNLSRGITADWSKQWLWLESILVSREFQQNRLFLLPSRPCDGRIPDVEVGDPFDVRVGEIVQS